MARVIRILCLVLLVITLSFNLINAAGNSGPENSPKPLEIINITPSGEDVPAGRQITSKFNRPVVPVGRMERDASEIPIEIKPEVKGQWRWLDTTTLPLMLDEYNTLSLATHYKITINPGIKAEDGATLNRSVKHFFITERPKVNGTRFNTWESPGMPVIRIIFNQPVSKNSLEKHLLIRIKGKEKKTIIFDIKPDLEYEKFLERNQKNYDEGYIQRTFPELMSQYKRKDKFTFVKNGIEYRTIWIVTPKDELPEGSSIEYHIKPGLESIYGPESGTENRMIDSVLAFPSFSFLGIECYDDKGKNILIKQNDEGPCCNPDKAMSLVFSSPVFEKEAMENISVEPAIRFDQNDYPEQYYHRSGSLNQKEFEKYIIDLPGSFEPNKKYTIKSNSKNIIDVFGRIIDMPFEVRFSTGHLTPDYHYDPVVVLEKDADTEMPFYATNLDSVTFTYDRLTARDKDISLKVNVNIPKNEDEKTVIPLNIRGMLAGQSGIVSGHFETIPPLKENDYSHINYFLAQVTPFHVHLKESKFSTMVWVTDMATGAPVPDAKVELYKGKDKNHPDINNLKVLAQEITDNEGVASFSIGTGELHSTFNSWRDEYRHLAVRVTKSDDTALIIDRYYDVGTPYFIPTNASIWGTTAQGVYRPGDTVQYKIYVRDQDNKAFISAPKNGYSLVVKDPLRKVVFESKDLVLTEFGALHGEFKIPETGASGEYIFELSTPFFRWPLSPMKVLVSDFSPSSFEVTTEIDKKIYHAGDNVKISTSAKLHSSGAYGGAGVRVTLTLNRFYSPHLFFPEDSPAKGFNFDMPDKKEVYDTKTLEQFDGRLDKDGNLVTNFKVSDDLLFGKLIMESAVRDERGKYVSELTSAKYSSRDRFAGLKSKDGRNYKDELCKSEILIVDATGKPIPDIPVSMNLEHREIVYPEPRPGINLAHSSELEKWTGVESHTVRSGNKPFEYSFILKEAGQYRVTASIKDSKGREHISGIPVYVYEKPIVRSGDQESKLVIVPEKTKYNVGDTARYTIKNPFPGAKALISIERNGIIKHWVQTLDTARPVIDVKIEKDYFPEYYLSVVVMSPGTEKYYSDKNKGHGKPEFKMDYVKTILNEPYKELVVEVKPLKEKYQPGDKVKVALYVTQRDPHSNEPVELAVVVLNEEVFQLLKEGKDYFNPYKGFYTNFGLGVQNYNLLNAYLGLQDFKGPIELEKIPFKISDSLFVSAFKLNEVDRLGNSRKESALRTNFKKAAYWNPSIIADKEGKASIEFEAPDNLTGWRILAIAVTPTDQMGLGEGKFAVTKDTEIRPVMPNQVTEGDSFKAGFSIMNRTDKTRELTVSITAEGAIETDPGKNNKEITQTITAEPNKRNTVWLPLKKKGSGKIKFTARGGDSTDQDGLVHELEVRKMVSLETSATYGTSVEKTMTESLQFPDGIRTDVGNVKVSLSPTVIGNVEGAFSYMRDYPYECWEQNLTRAVMASHYQNLKKYVPADFTWDGSDTLPQTMIDKAASHQAPNGGMAYYTPNDQYADQYLSAYTAIAFSWLAERGYKIPVDVQEKLNGYLSNLLKKEETPDYYSKGMASTVKAVALYTLVKQSKIGIDDIKKYYPHVKDMDLFGQAHFLLAAIMLKGTEEMQKELFNMILSHSDQTGGKFVFSETLNSDYSRILTSSLRTNAAILSSLIAYGNTEQGKTLIGDIPFKIVRYITQTRKQTGRWENTQENIFCMNALIGYSQTYEKTKPDMTILTKLGQETMGETRFRDMRDKPVELSRPIQANDPGRKTAVTIEREGEGRLYYSAGMIYAPVKPNTEPINAGIDIKREYAVERNGEWILLKSPMEIKRGELVRVDLFVSIPAARNFLVINDPVPGGLEPVNSDLATSSIVDAQKGEYKPAGGSWWFHYGDWSYYGISRWSFYHRELRHHAAIFYSEYLAPGNYHLLYTAQAIASGEFTVMPAHAEEMYDPDVFGKSGAGILKVKMGD